MKQHEAVIQVMEEAGGVTTLGYLYEHVLDVPGVIWRTKTPHASIRRIVQDDRFFFKIRPGVWALKSHRKQVLKEYGPPTKPAEKDTKTHSLYQGLLVELGNLRGFKTHVPPQDKNRSFLGQKLKDIATVQRCYDFGYPRFIRKARTVDVTWFNERKMPDSWFEVEHSTDINNSLLKFLELRDFSAQCWIVASAVRKREFLAKLESEAFASIRKRVGFMTYEQVARLHESLSRSKAVERELLR